MDMIFAAGNLDWDGWLLGIMGAIISGGAGSISSGFGSILIDPKDFNVLQGGVKHVLALMGIVFVFSAIISLAKFLQTQPVPNKLKRDLADAATASAAASSAIASAQKESR